LRCAGDPVPYLPPRPFYRHVTDGVTIGTALAELIANHASNLYADNLAKLGR
jgi:NAD/NADP transhydrogenase alpha subunit